VSGRPILIMAGGTGGHVYPALAVAEALREQARDVVWLGTRRGLEARVVPAAGIEIEWIGISGLRGKGVVTRLLAPFRLAVALVQSLVVILRRRPAAVLGMGGFVSGPGGVAAWLTRRPLIIHEQNAVPGLTNRLLAGLARVVLQAFPGSFSSRIPAQTVGNPVRRDIAALPPPAERLHGRAGPLRLLVLGGSQGALALNQLLPFAVAALPPERRPEVRHQAGGQTLETARETYRLAGIDAEIAPFIEDMAAAYAWADLVVCRAGALTVSEVALVGLAAVFIPFPAAVDDHQTANAAVLSEAGAALIVQERDLTPERLAGAIEELGTDREALLVRAERARAAAAPAARATITDLCLEAAGGAP